MENDANATDILGGGNDPLLGVGGNHHAVASVLLDKILEMNEYALSACTEAEFSKEFHTIEVDGLLVPSKIKKVNFYLIDMLIPTIISCFY